MSTGGGGGGVGGFLGGILSGVGQAAGAIFGGGTRTRPRIPEVPGPISVSPNEIDISAADRARLRRQRRAAAGGQGRQGTILTRDVGTVLGVTTTQPKTLLGL